MALKKSLKSLISVFKIDMVHHIFNNIEDADNTILIVGYCAEGTLGAKLRDYPITVKLFGKELRVRAKIKIIDGIHNLINKIHNDLVWWSNIN